ncbi:hypothetical protein [Tsukamurella pulmonis]|uniref:hypothetical protein n=1 Tax=Tsukamurella pulmonis TaxID=47312 RepID=UPI000E09817C|nr:hypothetical protein [Tsukamurella pulmonis]RDH13400.1 hypothetical protein DVB88_02595 [Tsukamurella pulmonis]
MAIKITATPNGGRPADPSTPPSADFDTTMPARFASSDSREREARTEAANYAAHGLKAMHELNASAEAVRALRPVKPPHLRPTPSGRTNGVWDPLKEKEVRKYSRVSGWFDREREAGENSESVVDELLDRAGRGEGRPDEDPVERIARIEDRDRLADAARHATHRAGAVTAARLTKLARDNKRAMMEAAQADLRDLVADAHQAALALEGVDSAEVAIKLGEAAVIAWGTRDGLRERMLTVAQSVHFIRRATTDGFGYVQGRSPDALNRAGLETETSASTWAVVDQWLEDLGTKDAAVDLLVGR